MVKNWIIHWVAGVVALFIITQAHVGIWADNIPTLMIAVIILAFINSFIRPVIMILAFPINCMTFGLFGFVLNVLLFQFVGNGKIVPGFHVKDFWAALVGSIAMGFLSAVISFFLTDRKE